MAHKTARGILMESLNEALIIELAEHGRARYFVKLSLVTGDVLLHTGVGQRLFLDKVWVGVGMLGEIGEIPANENNDASRINLSLTTNDEALLGEVAENDPVGCLCEIYLVTLDINYRVSNSQLLESANVVSCNVERGDTSKIVLAVAGESERWKQARLKQRWNDATQSELYPGDNFFKEQASTQNVLNDVTVGNVIGWESR